MQSQEHVWIGACHGSLACIAEGYVIESFFIAQLQAKGGLSYLACTGDERNRAQGYAVDYLTIYAPLDHTDVLRLLLFENSESDSEFA